MNAMTRALPLAATLALLGLSLAGCGGGGGGTTVGMTPTTPTPPAKFEAQFGANFAADYQASNTAEPKAVAAGDVIAVNPTAEPVALPSS
jgi:hypothetical protein